MPGMYIYVDQTNNAEAIGESTKGNRESTDHDQAGSLIQALVFLLLTLVMLNKLRCHA